MKHILLFLLVVSFSVLHAQPYIDIVNVRYYSMPINNSLYSHPKYNSEWITAGMDVPIKLKDNYLLISPYFETYTTFEFLYGIALPITFVKQWKNPSWKTAFTFIPRLSYEEQEISSSDIHQYGGVVLAIYKKKENLKYKFGVYYNSEYFGFFMLPLLGIDWNINSKWNLFGALPGSMSLEYKMMKRIYTGIAFRSITNSFRKSGDDYFKIEDNHLRLFADFYITKHLVFTAEGGHSIFRKYSRNYGGKIEKAINFKDGTVYKAALSWRIRLDEKKPEQ
jgi:hypothetical protein